MRGKCLLVRGQTLKSRSRLKSREAATHPHHLPPLPPLSPDAMPTKAAKDVFCSLVRTSKAEESESDGTNSGRPMIMSAATWFALASCCGLQAVGYQLGDVSYPNACISWGTPISTLKYSQVLSDADCAIDLTNSDLGALSRRIEAVSPLKPNEGYIPFLYNLYT